MLQEGRRRCHPDFFVALLGSNGLNELPGDTCLDCVSDAVNYGEHNEVGSHRELQTKVWHANSWVTDKPNQWTSDTTEPASQD